MKKQIIIFFIVLQLLSYQTILAQNTRISNNNNIGWYNYFGTFNFNKKLGLHTEYQWRRDQIVTERQQNLLRLGLNYQLNAKIQLRAGYAKIETFPYGDIPINTLGKDFTEHRLFQMATVNDKVSLFDLSHRFMLEQRWLGRYSNANLSKEDEFVFSNRLRYLFRIQMPLKGKTIENKTPYVALYDEIIIGFGKNVNENIFDQNRVGVLLGYKFSPSVRLEGGYLNQTLQLGREVDNRNVFQYNNGIIINTIFNFDLASKK